MPTFFITNRNFSGPSILRLEYDCRDINLYFGNATTCTYHRTDTGNLNDATETNLADFVQDIGFHGYNTVLFCIHGYNTSPNNAHETAHNMQKNLDNNVVVIPLFWPSVGLRVAYYKDRRTVYNTSTAIGKCMFPLVTVLYHKQISVNIIAHSMGNYVLSEFITSAANNGLYFWRTVQIQISPARYAANGDYHAAVMESRKIPMIQNIFMIAADINDNSLDIGQTGHRITESARNVCVYFAPDDFALGYSEFFNRRQVLGDDGPRDINELPSHVHVYNCDELNTKSSHSYFIHNTIFQHIIDTMRTNTPLSAGYDGRNRKIFKFKTNGRHEAYVP